MVKWLLKSKHLNENKEQFQSTCFKLEMQCTPGKYKWIFSSEKHTPLNGWLQKSDLNHAYP